MNVDSILISEFASAVDNCLTVYRTINRIRAKALPARHGMMSVSLILHGHPSESGTEHESELRLLNARREVLASFPNKFAFTEDEPVPGLPIRQIVIFGLVNLELKEVGPFAFEVHIDGTYHAGAAFVLALMED